MAVINGAKSSQEIINTVKAGFLAVIRVRSRECSGVQTAQFLDRLLGLRRL
jgi:hypothetical protein